MLERSTDINFTRKNAETKREEFRKYLESNGILDALTKVLVGLYEEPEKPMDPLEYPFTIKRICECIHKFLKAAHACSDIALFRITAKCYIEIIYHLIWLCLVRKSSDLKG